ncbi:MAG TPA: hypothetical protein VMY35_10920, partial [Phycisphaerae bacterium]|nr:hypothetical protein [Phycisphaerae bacterium]
RNPGSFSLSHPLAARPVPVDSIHVIINISIMVNVQIKATHSNPHRVLVNQNAVVITIDSNSELHPQLNLAQL